MSQITVNPPEKILQVDQNKLQKTNDRLSVELLQVKSCDKNNNDGFKPNTLDVRGVTGFNREDLNLTDGQDLEWAVNNFLSARNTANVDKVYSINNYFIFYLTYMMNEYTVGFQ